MKKFFASSVLATAVLFPVLVNAEELNFPANMTVDQKVEIRKGATESYPVVSSISTGQNVIVIDKFTNSFGETWYQVDLGNVKGWGPADHFITASSSGIQIGKEAIINSDNANVRKGATASYEVTAKLSKGQIVKVIDSFKNSSNELWYQIETGSIKGWVHSELLSPKPEANPAPPAATTVKTVQVDKTAVRRGASDTYRAVKYLVKGQKVTIIDTFKNSKGETWYRVDLGAVQGWVIDTAFKPLSLPPAPNTSVATKYVGTKNAALYAGASFQYKVKERLAYNSKVTVLSEFVNSLNQTWVQIKTSTGKTGWTPKYELISSKNDLQYVYAMNNTVIRRGAGTNYSVSAYLKVNDQLIVLQELNGWLNVETLSGKRGWIDKSLTSNVSMKRLISPTVQTIDGDQHLVWKKTSNFHLTYSILSSNRLKLSGGFTAVEVPSAKIEGISSIDSSGVITFEPGYTFTIRNYPDKVTIKIIENGLVGKKIIVDAGHGGKDTGAIGPTGLREKDVNLATALLLKAELEKKGAIVTLTRSTDIFLELQERTAIANKSNYDAFISIHADSFSSTSKGTTTYYNTTVNFNGPKSRKMADAIQKNMISSMGTYNRGVKEQEFYVNRMNQLPSILVELAFISNPNEEKLLRSTDFRKKAAIGITKGLEEYFTNF
ncbi:N-acetylmuramoyl-L-alanine amidase [Bacillus methanolicus]|uniref:N-acetylmuramoyl-L-alanine amidase n=1 Tax=Bacillus methanolicus TaxID=1471 RepID=UPI002380443E|nr:N-acetylmuramoyl-L-alanine amidase [Bacillus methanolicus]